MDESSDSEEELQQSPDPYDRPCLLVIEEIDQRYNSVNSWHFRITEDPLEQLQLSVLDYLEVVQSPPADILLFNESYMVVPNMRNGQLPNNEVPDIRLFELSASILDVLHFYRYRPNPLWRAAQLPDDEMPVYEISFVKMQFCATVHVSLAPNVWSINAGRSFEFPKRTLDIEDESEDSRAQFMDLVWDAFANPQVPEDDEEDELLYTMDPPPGVTAQSDLHYMFLDDEMRATTTLRTIRSGSDMTLDEFVRLETSPADILAREQLEINEDRLTSIEVHWRVFYRIVFCPRMFTGNYPFYRQYTSFGRVENFVRI